MFTLHFQRQDGSWSIAVGPNLTNLESFSGFIVVPETESTRKLTALLQTYHEDCSRILAILKKLLILKPQNQKEVFQTIRYLATESEACEPECSKNARRLLTLFNTTPADKPIYIQAFFEVIQSLQAFRPH